MNSNIFPFAGFLLMNLVLVAAVELPAQEPPRLSAKRSNAGLGAFPAYDDAENRRFAGSPLQTPPRVLRLTTSKTYTDSNLRSAWNEGGLGG
jgi:hypothetical protein